MGVGFVMGWFVLFVCLGELEDDGVVGKMTNMGYL